MPNINIVVDTTPIYIRYSPVTTPTIGVKFGAVDSVNGQTGVVLVNSVPNGGTTGQVLAKNSNDDNDTEWVNQSGGGTWGSITGTLSAQTDLQTALDAKEDTANKQTDLTPSATKFPTVNAVIAGLAKFPFVLFKRTTPITHTGTTTPTKVASILIPVGALEANDIWEISARVVASLNGNNKHFRIKVNTTDSLSGAVTIATMTMTSTMNGFKRILWFNNTLSAVGALNTVANYAFDETATIVNSSLVTATFNFANAFYLLIECELASAADNIVIHNYFSTIKRGSAL